MEKYILKYADQLNPITGLRWISKLPSDVLNQHVLLKLFQCTFLLMLTEISELKEILATLDNLEDSAMARYTDE